MAAQHYLTIHDLATRWSVSTKTINRWKQNPPQGKPQLKPTLTLGRRALFLEREVEQWEAAGPVASMDAVHRQADPLQASASHFRGYTGPKPTESILPDRNLKTVRRKR